MLEQLADAFERQDYQTAAGLLKQLMQESPQNPWVQLYLGRLQEATGKLESAEIIYRQLLRDTTNSKVVAQARQGLQRLEATQRERRQQAIAQATADPSSTEHGVLVLEPISSESKTKAAQQFARIMQLDPYSARLQLPSRSWRLYRTGPVGELRYYSQQLQSAEIPNLCVSVTEIEKLHVFRVSHFQSVTPQTTVVCENEQGQLGSLTFNWSEVQERVEGLLPIFEQVVDQDARHQLLWKTQTQDYAQFCDLHLPSRRTILRLSDSTYQFPLGVPFTSSQSQPTSQTTNRRNWNNLLSYLNQQLSQKPVWSDFTIFAQTAIDFTELLGRLTSHIDLFRREETPWDAAFQLYSGLVFLKGSRN